MILRHIMIFMLMSCYICSFGQSENDPEQGDQIEEEYFEEEYIEEEDYSRMHFIELQLHLSDASGALNRNLNGKYIGFGMDYLFQLSSDRPGFIGVSFDYTFLESAGLTTFDPVDGFPFDYSTSTGLGNISAIYRHYLGVNLMGLEPFVEGAFGLTSMMTSTSITSSDDPEFSEFDFNNFDVSMSYAFRGGIHYAVADAVYMTAKVGYLRALSTKYDIEDEDLVGEVSSLDYFSRKSSALDVIRYDLGVTFAF